jgi:hypothetical protein
MAAIAAIARAWTRRPFDEPSFERISDLLEATGEHRSG